MRCGLADEWQQWQQRRGYQSTEGLCERERGWGSRCRPTKSSLTNKAGVFSTAFLTRPDQNTLSARSFCSAAPAQRRYRSSPLQASRGAKLSAKQHGANRPNHLGQPARERAAVGPATIADGSDGIAMALFVVRCSHPRPRPSRRVLCAPATPVEPVDRDTI